MVSIRWHYSRLATYGIHALRTHKTNLTEKFLGAGMEYLANFTLHERRPTPAHRPSLPWLRWTDTELAWQVGKGLLT